ncbi:PQQ-dependent dehydrogenase, methanol/ethanol family [bacterium]|nr:PQQ-dependent dehydrogenase, methanol/ethanol family [bacterium]
MTATARLAALILPVCLLATACSKTADQDQGAEHGGEHAGSGAEHAGHSAEKVAAVDTARIIAADSEPGSWMSHGRTYDEQRHSPLKGINASNVGKLGLAWTHRLDVDRGTEATPIVVDGVMYTTGAYSMVYALNPVTGEQLWKYDPEVNRATGGKGCCGVVNRGVAVWDGKVFIGVYDGRLEALDAKTGEVLWSKVTVDQSKNYTITGAPRVVDGKVLIGNGGAEFGVRGYISAYDANTGEMLWRWFTVPGNPAEPPENEAMKVAQKTWHGDTYWKQGGGGTVWDSMAYDPDTGFLIIGTGNGSPWNIKYRSEGKGDNLYLSSIVALDVDTGEYQWHYQTTPGDTWDYTATQHIILADLEIDGEQRKVAMQAPKNGFFYVVDRTNGELISAEAFVPMNWASGIDDNGRPIKLPAGDYSEEPKIVTPSPFGAHNWQPMSYNPDTGLVYIPAQITALLFEDFGQTPAQALNVWNIGLAPLKMPEAPAELAGVGEQFKGMLLAWDPVAQKAAWTVDYASPWNGGTLSTAGNLVFQGTADGRAAAYNAKTGELLWDTPANTGVIAAPMTYEIDGEQYVTFMAGWGGTFALVGAGAFEEIVRRRSESRVLTFKLGGKQSLPEPANIPVAVPTPPPVQATPEQIDIGRQLYHGLCVGCHGASAISGGLVPDLRYMKEDTHKIFGGIVAGAYAKRGMPSFGHVLPPEQTALIHQYVIKRSHDLVAQLEAQDEDAE